MPGSITWLDMDANEALWIESYERTVEYVRKMTIAGLQKSEPLIGSWTATQRRLYNSNKLSADRINKLELILGWTGIRLMMLGIIFTTN